MSSSPSFSSSSPISNRLDQDSSIVDTVPRKNQHRNEELNDDQNTTSIFVLDSSCSTSRNEMSNLKNNVQFKSDEDCPCCDESQRDENQNDSSSNSLFLTIEEEALFVSRNSNRYFENGNEDCEEEQEEDEQNGDEADVQQQKQHFFPKYFNGDLKENLPTMFVSASGRSWFVERKNLKNSVEKFVQEKQQQHDQNHEDDSGREKTMPNKNIVLFFNQREFRQKFHENVFDHPTGWNFENPLSQDFFNQNHQKRFTGFTSANGKMIFLKNFEK
jgi:hypothetical protein